MKWKRYAKFFWKSGPYEVQKLSVGWVWRKIQTTGWNAAANVHAAKAACERDAKQ